MLLTKSEFAKLVKKNTSTIHANITSNLLVVDEKTGKLETENPVNKRYLQKRINSKDKSSSEETIKKFELLTLQEGNFKLKKLQADVRLKTLIIKEKRGDLVSKKRIADLCFSYLDTLNKNLLVVPQVFIDRVENYIKNLSDNKESKKELLNEITSYLTKMIHSTKTQIGRKISESYDIDEDEIYDD